MKKSLNEQKHLAQRRKGAEAEKKTEQMSTSNLCASASLREIVYFFTASQPFHTAGGRAALTTRRAREFG